ncbi:MAG: hypothetical protein B7Z75_05230 [Acidocella sp. 20-57-95]|nr:MAG: hypothetical protein B7Z75_05230 [Acidocella sp. 20-57-95]OYV57923.1 MAG: hypothetical protein B7Z71_11630 [Acidocella sp. 21-58-7]HQT64653.1 DUF2177 family protein [Acidocella sp.]
MRTPFIAYITSLVVMGIMDGCWLGFATSRLYRPGIGHLMTDKPVVPAAVLFYLLYAAGVTYLITLPALTSGGLSSAIMRGAVFGLIAYGTYDLTSLAILQNWPLNVTVADMIWGAIITGATAGIALLVTQKFG